MTKIRVVILLHDKATVCMTIDIGMTKTPAVAANNRSGALVPSTGVALKGNCRMIEW